MQNEIIGIVGRKGSGKTTALRRIMQPLPRIMLWDPLGEHRWCPNPIKTIERLQEFFLWARGLDSFAARFIAQSDLPGAFDAFADLVFRKGHLVVGTEEVPMISQPNWLPDGFDRLVRLGRHRAVSIVWTAQRMSEVARRLLASGEVAVLAVRRPLSGPDRARGGRGGRGRTGANVPDAGHAGFPSGGDPAPRSWRRTSAPGTA